MTYMYAMNVQINACLGILYLGWALIRVGCLFEERLIEALPICETVYFLDFSQGSASNMELQLFNCANIPIQNL